MLEDLTPEEGAHMAAVAQKQQGPVNERALEDYIRIIRQEYDSRSVSSEKDLLALRDKLRERKGYEG